MKLINIRAICLIAMLALVVGCNTGAEQDSAQSSDSHAHPNLSLHKPKNLSTAIDRLQQMHASLIADGELPAPISIPYVEVIHGEGAAGHSHFYSEAEFEAGEEDDQDDHHHEEDEKVKHHTMEIDLRTELADVIGWLPDIAAKSDLTETDWNSVKSTSSSLTEIIDGVPSDASDASFRETWKTKSEEIKAMLDGLKGFADSSGAVK